MTRTSDSQPAGIPDVVSVVDERDQQDLQFSAVPSDDGQREERLSAIRCAVDAGHYESEQILSRAIDRLIQFIREQEPLPAVGSEEPGGQVHG